MSSVAIIGLGATGSALVPLVARMTSVDKIVLVDFDDYTPSNVANQAIDESAVGRAKVEVQAGQIRAINPAIRVEAINERVENVPLGHLDTTISASCVDSMNARQTISRIATRLGNRWVDAAVSDDSLVRINGYLPGQAAPCLECAWNDNSRALLAQEYPCDAGHVRVPATGTPAELGALAAALQAGVIRRTLDDPEHESTLPGAQLMFDTETYTRHLVRFERNDQCLFDHQIWAIERMTLPLRACLSDLFEAVDTDTDCSISLEGQTFALCVECIGCGRRSHVGLSLVGRLSDSDRTCNCGGQMLAPGFFSLQAIRRPELHEVQLGLTLDAVGIRAGDVISVTSGQSPVRHIELREESHDHE